MRKINHGNGFFECPDKGATLIGMATEGPPEAALS